MSNSLIRKLAVANNLTDEDKAVLERACSQQLRFEADQDLTREDDQPKNVHLVLKGFAARYKLMPEGKRHIMALLVPGDFCDLHVAILGQMDHSIATLTPCTVVTIPRSTIIELTAHPRINHALWWATLVDEAVLREWLANQGQREANKRIAHFFCELLVRLQMVGLADANSYDFPLTQMEIADTLGMTPVHANRTLRFLRSEGLIVIEKRKLSIPDVKRLNAFCDFNPNYLHMNPRDNSTHSQTVLP